LHGAILHDTATFIETDHVNELDLISTHGIVLWRFRVDVTSGRDKNQIVHMLPLPPDSPPLPHIFR
jgi:hypothetical protein